MSLLCFLPTLQAMDWFNKSKERKTPEINNKPTISKLDDVKKMKEFQQQYRSKHQEFAQEHNREDKHVEKK